MVNRLWITEKPSAAKSLAAGVCSALKVSVSNQGASTKDGCIKLSNGDVIAFLFGHLIQPIFLGPEHKRAQMDSFFDFLPIVVKDWAYEPRYERNKNGEIKMSGGKPVPIRQYQVVTDLIRKSKEIVNAGDVDREGQLIVDELLIHCGIDPEGSKKPIWRLPLVSDREDDIRKQVLNLTEKNGDPKWVRRRHAALARAYCDAAVGFNGSMAYQAATGYRRASVGRVQTPVLCLVVDREAQINAFKPRNYYVPIITMADGTEMRFHRREDAQGQPGFDEQGRIIDENVAKQMCALIASGLKGQITQAGKVKGSEAPPLPFSATVLASTVSKRTGMLPTQAEAAAQSLYEKHKAISYVGTDCRFLPESKHAEARATLGALGKVFVQQASGAQLDLRSKAWNDSKVDEHFAIIPTGVLPQNATAEEKAVFEAVSMRYIAQFYPAFEYVTHRLSAMFGKDEFRAARRETTRMGWKQIEGHLEQGGPKSEDSSENDDFSDDATEVEMHVDRHKGGR